jgi:predicted nucleic-acid-binding protein
VGDDQRQAELARAELDAADEIVLPLPALCELVWVLESLYRIPRQEIAVVIRGLIDTENARIDRLAADAGLAQLEAGGDFADGVIAYEGRRLGADEFVSFDRRAVRLLQARGEPARLLA